MLSELKDILDRLQTGNFAENAQQQRASRMMKDLSDVISKQQKLLDDTFKAKREQRATASRAERPVRGEPSRPAARIRSRHEHGAPVRAMPGEAEQGSEKGQGESGEQGSPRGPGQLEQGQQPQGQRPGQHGPLGDRQAGARDKLQSLIDRLRIEGGEPPEQFEGAGKRP